MIIHPLGFILNAILKQNVTPEFYSAVLPLLGIATFTISMVIALLSIHIVKEVSMQFGRLKRKSAH